MQTLRRRSCWARFSLYALVLSSPVGCSSSAGDGAGDGEEPSGVVGTSGAVCPPNSQVTYATFAKSFLETYCTRCHSSAQTGPDRQGAPPNRNFDSLAQIRGTDAGLMDKVAAAGDDKVNEFMPPAGPRPTEDERRSLGEWLACGRP